MSEPPRPRKVTSRSVDTPWDPATTGTLPGGQRLAEAVGPDLEDLGLGVVGVGDDAGLAAGERDRRHAEVGEGHAQQGHRDALAGGEQHVDLARRLDARSTSPARRIRSSVFLPMALTTTTTSSPWRGSGRRGRPRRGSARGRRPTCRRTFGPPRATDVATVLAGAAIPTWPPADRGLRLGCPAVPSRRSAPRQKAATRPPGAEAMRAAAAEARGPAASPRRLVVAPSSCIIAVLVVEHLRSGGEQSRPPPRRAAGARPRPAPASRQRLPPSAVRRRQAAAAKAAGGPARAHRHGPAPSRRSPRARRRLHRRDSKHYTATSRPTRHASWRSIHQEAPSTVNSFVFLASYQFYDGVIFHRVTRASSIQGGDPTGHRPGRPRLHHPRRVPAQGQLRTHRSTRSVSVAMANPAPSPNGGSQFFIVVGPRASRSPEPAATCCSARSPRV